MLATAVTIKWGNDGCWLYWYEPEKPEGVEQVTRKDLMKLVRKTY